MSAVYQKEKFDASRVFNVDETGMSTVQLHKEKVVAQCGKKQIGKIVSAERGETVTAVVCASASGVFIPPMLIFARKNLNNRLLHGAPPGTVAATSTSGWINCELYLKWLAHFVKHTASSTDRKVLLVLDNHESHVSLQSWEMCRDNGIVVVSLPPHCSHKCQPLDLTFFGPLKTAYYKRCAEWLKMNPGKRITQYEVASLFGDAYCSTAVVQKCINGFKAAGIYPLNSSVIRDEDFQAAENLVKHASTELSAATATLVMNTKDAEPVTGDTADEPQPSQQSPAKRQRFSVLDISPLPIATAKENSRRRKCKRSEVFTASPMKAILEAKVLKNAGSSKKALVFFFS